jgi:hypothetical protein
MPHRHAIERLRPHSQAIRVLTEQKVPVGRFLPCYDRLLLDKPPWTNAKRILGNNRVISRAHLKAVASSCQQGRESWPSLFVLAMLWGYGENDDSGPVKLFFALGDPEQERIIEHTATQLLAGQLSTALLTIRELPKIGTSYGTKFLYAAGSVSIHAPSALVLDENIVKALRRVWGQECADTLFHLKAMKYTYAKGKSRAATGYVAYCQTMEAVGAELDVEPAKLEQFLFENAATV